MGKPVSVSSTLFSNFVCSISTRERSTRLSTGRYVSPISFRLLVKHEISFKQYENVEGFEVHGYERFVYQYIRQEFPDEIDYNINQMKIYALDIEVQCENGFPNVEEAAEEMLSITIKDMVTKKYYHWATREFEAPEGCRDSHLLD